MPQKILVDLIWVDKRFFMLINIADMLTDEFSIRCSCLSKFSRSRMSFSKKWLWQYTIRDESSTRFNLFLWVFFFHFETACISFVWLQIFRWISSCLLANYIVACTFKSLFSSSLSTVSICWLLLYCALPLFNTAISITMGLMLSFSHICKII